VPFPGFFCGKEGLKKCDATCFVIHAAPVSSIASIRRTKAVGRRAGRWYVRSSGRWRSQSWSLRR